jgi:hypothetical protein
MLDDVQVYVFYSDVIDRTDDWSNTFFEKRVQTGNDLGERMCRAFEEVLQQYQNVCIIGSDCPALTTEMMNKAYKALETNDFVIGPSTDGGYYLLGMSVSLSAEAGVPAYLFEEMAWSTARVFSETRERMQRHEKSLLILPELTDVDEESDWLLFQKSTHPNQAKTTS